MKTICSYFDPCSKDHHAIDDFKKLSCPKLLAIGLVTVCLSWTLIFVVPIFRLLVERCKVQTSLTQVDQQAQEAFNTAINSVNLPTAPIPPWTMFNRSTPISTSLTPQHRRYPPLAFCDTIIGVRNKDTGEWVIRSEHVQSDLQSDLFKEAEILEVHQVIRTEMVKETTSNGFIDSMEIGFSKHGKAIIQQQAIRGCTAGAVAMLRHDNGKAVSIKRLRSCNLGNNASEVRDIEEAGLTAKVTEKMPFTELADSIQKHGSAILSIDGEVGGHVIVLDEITEKTARIRDPYHGWEITVTAEALKKRCGNECEIIQIGH